MSLSTVLAYKHAVGIANGLPVADEDAVREINDAVQLAERSGDSFAVALVTSTLGIALMHADQGRRDHGLRLLARTREPPCSGDSR